MPSLRNSLLLAGLLALAPFARAGDVSLSAIVRDHKLSATEAAAAILIADALKLDATFVIGTGRQSGTSLIALGPAFVLSHETGKPVGEIWKRRKRGRGWGVIAKEMGMHPGQFNKLRRSGEFDRSAWVVLLGRRYGYGDADLKALERQGCRRGDALVAAVLSNGDRSKMKTAVAEWKNDKSWKLSNPRSAKQHEHHNHRESHRHDSHHAPHRSPGPKAGGKARGKR